MFRQKARITQTTNLLFSNDTRERMEEAANTGAEDNINEDHKPGWCNQKISQ